MVRRGFEVTTLLEITGAGLTPYAARGLTQTLEPIAAASHTRRTINGSLKDNSQLQFQKYRSSISCKDMDAPQFDGNWPGKSLTVKCVAELSYVTIGGTPQRSVVTASSRVVGLYTMYRPILIMRLIKWNVADDEYEAAVNWSMELEEV
jgi:hypothetical protein